MKATMTVSPTYPYTTDGIPAKRSVAGRMKIRTHGGAISAKKTAPASPNGPPIRIAMNVVPIEPAIKVSAPNLPVPGLHLLVVKNSITLASRNVDKPCIPTNQIMHKIIMDTKTALLTNKYRAKRSLKYTDDLV